jgi:hydroxylamine reductase (hybrid-cluster protein)
MALGLASLGLKVCVAVPLPLWGSEKVRSLLSKRFAAVGGGMTHFDHPVGLQEILEWFSK